MCCVKNKVNKNSSAHSRIRFTSVARLHILYKDVISVADQFQNVDATHILMLNIEIKSPCEKYVILTQYMPSVVQYDIA